MSEYSYLKATINANVKTNDNHEITGSIMNSVLNAMVTSLGAGYQFIGVATPTNPGSAQTPDYKCFYLATTPGTYTYLGGLVVTDGEVALLKWDTSWTKEVTGIASADKLNQLGQEFYNQIGFSKTEDASISETGWYYLINNIFIPSGAKFKVVASGTYNWTRAIIAYNRITAQSGRLLDYVVKGREYEITAPAEITSLQLYIVSGSGDGTVSLSVEYNGVVTGTINERIDNVENEIVDNEHSIANNQKDIFNKEYYNTISVSETGRVVINDNIYIKSGQKFAITLGGDATIGRTAITYNDDNTIVVDYVQKGKKYELVAPTDITKIKLYLIDGTPSGTISSYIFIGNNLPQNNFVGFRKNATISSSASVCKIGNIHIAKNIMLSARVTGLGASDTISFGIGYNLSTSSRRETHAMYFKIASNSIELYRASDPSNPTLVQTWQYSLLDYSDIMLTLTVDNTENANWKFIIEDCRGVDTIIEGDEWVGSGEPFVESLSATVNVDISFMPRDICRRIWVFGDSYTQPITSNMKWPNRVIENDMYSFLLNALSGLNPVDGYNDLQNLLTLQHKPSFVFWCLGMNGPADIDQDTVNPTQKETIDNVLALCVANNIIPIFATIPTVPSRQKTALSNYIRSLGVRYVDVAEAVGSTPTGEWNPRLISYDNLHPSQYGALVIAQRVLLDFPEISVN